MSSENGAWGVEWVQQVPPHARAFEKGDFDPTQVAQLPRQEGGQVAGAIGELAVETTALRGTWPRCGPI